MKISFALKFLKRKIKTRITCWGYIERKWEMGDYKRLLKNTGLPDESIGIPKENVGIPRNTKIGTP